VDVSQALTLSQRALSRSGKKVLHLDSNQYYGGPDAAFSLDEAQEWVKEVNQGEIYLRSYRLLVANKTCAIRQPLII
jgi:RAB protein geranylgeranyltransferase component A